MTWEIREGDALERLREMPDGSVQCCVTSPPYWGLRDYGACDCGQGRYDLGQGEGTGGNMNYRSARHDPGCPKCEGTGKLPHAGDQLGLEPTPEEYVTNMVEVFREVRRILRDDGTLWLNIGDSYASSPPGNTTKGVSAKSTLHGVLSDTYRETLAASVQTKRNTVVGDLKPKDLVGIPWRVAFALQADGWWLRSDIIWAKPNPMPESVRDRPTKAHEYVFMLSKSATYFYDADAVAEPATFPYGPNAPDKIASPHGQGFTRRAKSGNKARKCGEDRDRPDSHLGASIPWEGSTRNRRSVWTITTKPYSEAHFATFPPELPEVCIKAGCPEGGTVLDPFAGAGTTGMVALRLGRAFVGIELNPGYAKMARNRIYDDAPLLNAVGSV